MKVSHIDKLNEQKKVWLKVSIAFIILILLIVIITLTTQNKSYRSDHYKETVGGAGLSATILYDCKDNCNKKFDFNVYLFNEDGTLFGTFRPDAEGKLQVAVAEGNYRLLVGKLLGKNKEFPQEPLELKNGKTLELKLQY